MKKITTIFSLVFLMIFATSCKNEKSLQSYLVDSNGKQGFITGDLPLSSFLSPKADVSEDVKETLQSIKKINVVFLPKTADNQPAYEMEKSKLKNIFKDNTTYKGLVTMKANGMNAKVFYAGNTDKIDEVILFGYSKDRGVGVARLLGENMNPAKIVKTLKNLELDENSAALKQFAGLFTK
ncbi:DUF4252 domain-containing protein [uncultured Polaribacter sp.]|uniref:DUF4252 domain-containing protein n=1 Tax=uncultured Polaribacter sp. TaxID=174711 RepID=UPI002615AB5E|nr:DUF4252 domain-containing protein [uncultured Polaribacter sp.]